MRALASFLMGSRWQAAIGTALLALLPALLPFLVVFTGGAISLCTLRRGTRETLLVMAMASALLIIASTVLWGLPAYAMAVLMLSWLPVMTLSQIHARSGNAAAILAAILFATVVSLALLHASMGDFGDFWVMQMTQMRETLKDIVSISFEPEAVRKMAWAFNGTLAASFACASVLSVYLGRSWQARLYNPGGFASEFRKLALSRGTLIFTAAIAVFAVLENRAGQPALAAEALIVVVIVFMFQGLAVFHALVHAGRLGAFWLVLVYLGLALPPFLPNAILLMAFVGIIDALVDFRRLSASEEA